MRPADALNRGFNLLATTILGLAGLAFGTIVFQYWRTGKLLDAGSAS